MLKTKQKYIVFHTSLTFNYKHFEVSKWNNTANQSKLRPRVSFSRGGGDLKYIQNVHLYFIDTESKDVSRPFLREGQQILTALSYMKDLMYKLYLRNNLFFFFDSSNNLSAVAYHMPIAFPFRRFIGHCH